MQVFTAGFAKRPKHIDVFSLPIFRVTKISIGEAVGFDDVLHDLICLCDDVSGGEEPQSPDKCVEPHKFSWIVKFMGQGVCKQFRSLFDELSI